MSFGIRAQEDARPLRSPDFAEGYRQAMLDVRSLPAVTGETIGQFMCERYNRMNVGPAKVTARTWGKVLSPDDSVAAPIIAEGFFALGGSAQVISRPDGRLMMELKL